MSLPPLTSAVHRRQPAPRAMDVTANGIQVARFLANARAFVGQRYQWGGGHAGNTFRGPAPVDCSGLVTQAARQAGLHLEGTAATLQRHGRAIARSELKPGDLLFRGHPANHVGIYLGNGQVLDATRSHGTAIRPLARAGFNSARRVFGA